MGHAPDIDDFDWHAALAALAWQVDLGVFEPTADIPLDRYDLPESQISIAAPKAGRPMQTQVPPAPASDPVAEAGACAATAATLSALREALSAFGHCDLRRGARNLVFAGGTVGAHLMIVGDAPGLDDDREGRPFCGAAGQLLDRMLSAIGLSRDGDDPARAAYIVPALPWRPPGDREALPEEIAMLRPFLMRHIALARPRVLIAMGNTACETILGKRSAARLRGTWDMSQEYPVMPMTHPATLLRKPIAKRDAWADLRAVQSRLSRPDTA